MQYGSPWSSFKEKWNKIKFEVETHSFKFAMHVSGVQHPSWNVNTNEPLVGVSVMQKRS